MTAAASSVIKTVFNIFDCRCALPIIFIGLQLHAGGNVVLQIHNKVPFPLYAAWLPKGTPLSMIS